MDGDLPTEDFHLISSCPCWAYTSQCSRTLKRRLIEAFYARNNWGSTLTTTNAEFVDYAQPHAWLLTAENLHSQALRVYESFGNTTISHVMPGGTGRTWDQSNRVMFLLAGFALENLIKSFLVYENPTWIENGRLSNQLRSHSLTKLAEKSTLLPYKVRGRVTLETLEDGLESWARYPCALTAVKTKEQLTFNPVLWDAYLKVSHSYTSKLIKLLRKEWDGPHGFNGRYEIDGGFFSFRPPMPKKHRTKR